MLLLSDCFEDAEEVVGVFFFRGQNVFEHAARRGVVGALQRPTCR